MFSKSISVIVLVAFLFSSVTPIPKAHANTLLGLPEPGTMVSLSPAYQPAIIKGVTVHKDNPFMFDFIVDVGQDKLQGEQLKAEGQKLIKYFLASLAIPEKDLWVNLSPYEKDRTIPEALGQTDMGRDLLAQDYILKQITASLIYPEKELGKSFWDRVYAKSQQLYGTTNIPVNTFNKVWIMADKAEVFERNNTAFVTDSHLKVMLEEDYLALSHNVIPAKAGIQSQIIKEIILPELEKEVNTGKNFANLRQIFNSLILASWYKNNLKAALLNQVYSDKEKVAGITVIPAKAGIQDTEAIYQRYLAAYKKGVFNYIKEDTAQGKTMPRKYFSGGMEITPNVVVDRSMLSGAQKLRRAIAVAAGMVVVAAGLSLAQPAPVQASPDLLVLASSVPTAEDRENVRSFSKNFKGGLVMLVLVGGAIAASIWVLSGKRPSKSKTPPAALPKEVSPEYKAAIKAILEHGLRVVKDDSGKNMVSLYSFGDAFKEINAGTLHDVRVQIKDHFMTIPVELVKGQRDGVAWIGIRYQNEEKNDGIEGKYLNELREEIRLWFEERIADRAQIADVDMSKFKVASQWQDQLKPYMGEGKVISPVGQQLMAQLTVKYASKRDERMAERAAKQEAVDEGEGKYGFLPANTVIKSAYGEKMTAGEIRNSDWKVTALPEELTRPGAILTGPWSTFKWAINALRSGAVRLFWDREDAGWDKGIEGIKAQQVASDIINGRINEYTEASTGKKYTVPSRDKWPVITNRVRGIQFDSKFFSYDGVPTPGMSEDLVTYVDNNQKALREAGSGVYIVLPKLETAGEVKDAIEQVTDIEKAYGLREGTIRIILMVETIELTLQLEEALWAGRKHIAITNVGRWDKMATDIRVRRADANADIPDPDTIGMQSPHMLAYVRRVTDITLKRGAEIEGGMFALMKSRNGQYPETDAKVTQLVKGDKTFERDEFGMKYAWGATPQVVPEINAIFQSGDYSHRTFKPYSYTDAEEKALMELPDAKGKVTPDAFEKAIYYQLAYTIGQRTAGGAVAIIMQSMPGLRAMQDYAIFKIFYYWTWFLNHNHKQLDGSDIRVNSDYVGQVIDKVIERIKNMPDADKFPDTDWDAVRKVIYRLNTSPNMFVWESLVMNAVIDETDPKVIDAKLDKVFADAAMTADMADIGAIKSFLEGMDEHNRSRVLAGQSPEDLRTLWTGLSKTGAVPQVWDTITDAISKAKSASLDSYFRAKPENRPALDGLSRAQLEAFKAQGEEIKREVVEDLRQKFGPLHYAYERGELGPLLTNIDAVLARKERIILTKDYIDNFVPEAAEVGPHIVPGLTGRNHVLALQILYWQSRAEYDDYVRTGVYYPNSYKGERPHDSKLKRLLAELTASDEFKNLKPVDPDKMTDRELVGKAIIFKDIFKGENSYRLVFGRTAAPYVSAQYEPRIIAIDAAMTAEGILQKTINEVIDESKLPQEIISVKRGARLDLTGDIRKNPGKFDLTIPEGDLPLRAIAEKVRGKVSINDLAVDALIHRLRINLTKHNIKFTDAAMTVKKTEIGLELRNLLYGYTAESLVVTSAAGGSQRMNGEGFFMAALEGGTTFKSIIIDGEPEGVDMPEAAALAIGIKEHFPSMGVTLWRAKNLSSEEKGRISELKINILGGNDLGRSGGPEGGIDLNAGNIQWKVSKDGNGVEMNVDAAMIERIKRDGIQGLTPVIFRITPVASIWPLLGMQEPKEEERLAGV